MGNFKHGMTGSRERNNWVKIKSKCYNVNHKNYHNHGLVGIQVCERWKDSFDNFFKDMGTCGTGLTINRKDESLDFTPKNCIWSEPKKTIKHGMSGSGSYVSWCNMKNRCYNANSLRYSDWGGRGIIVCERWKDSFENFYSDMGCRPDGMSLDRKNNDGNYEPSNCRWATKEQQMNNTRRN